MKRTLTAALTAVALLVPLSHVAEAHAPCNHQDHTHLHLTWFGVHIDHWYYIHTESIDAHHYRDVYLISEHGTQVRSGICP